MKVNKCGYMINLYVILVDLSDYRRIIGLKKGLIKYPRHRIEDIKRVWRRYILDVVRGK